MLCVIVELINKKIGDLKTKNIKHCQKSNKQ